MTTNQTIDGVPHKTEWCEALLKLEVVREALTSSDSAERLKNMDAGKVLREGIAILKELRALLYAKPETVAGHHSACRAVDDYKPGECSHSCKPAAQPQGEPVVCVELVENKTHGGMHIVKWDNLGKLKEGIHKLYAEQPATVACPHNRGDQQWPKPEVIGKPWHKRVEDGEVDNSAATKRTCKDYGHAGPKCGADDCWLRNE